MQLFTIAGAFIDGLVQGVDVPVLPAHNLDVNFGIAPSRVYVGWYQGGLQSWTTSGGGFERSTDPLAERTASIYHQVQLESQDDPYSGAWGVRTASIGGVVYNFVSDRNYGLLIGCSPVGCAPPPPTTTTTSTTTSTTLAPGATMHIANLDGSSEMRDNGRWNATVTVTLHDQFDSPVSAATVDGGWSTGANGSGSCTTDVFGTCSITKKNISGNSPSVTFTVTNATHSHTYDQSTNHDPDADSDGTTIVIFEPS